MRNGRVSEGNAAGDEAGEDLVVVSEIGAAEDFEQRT